MKQSPLRNHCATAALLSSLTSYIAALQISSAAAPFPTKTSHSESAHVKQVLLLVVIHSEPYPLFITVAGLGTSEFAI